MPVKIVKLSQLPRRKRHVTPKIAFLHEWAETLVILAENKLAPDHAITFTVPRAFMAQWKYKDARAVVRPVKKNIEYSFGTKYKVSAVTVADGVTVIIKRLKGTR